MIARISIGLVWSSACAPEAAPPPSTVTATPALVPPGVAPPAPVPPSAAPATAGPVVDPGFSVRMVLEPGRALAGADGGPRVNSGPPTTDGVIAGFAAGFSRCVNAAAARAPGSVTPSPATHRVRLQLGEQGEVLSATPVATGSLPPEAVECLLARGKSAQFDPDRGRRAIEVRFLVVRREP